jgi:hypothetical protein
MSPRGLLLPLPLCAAAHVALAAASAQEPLPPASIVRITLQAEEDERQPVTVPTEPQNTVEVDFPWPVEEWAGRGFTPDPEKYSGDFVIEATRGKPRIFVTPVVSEAHRVLHVVLALPGGLSRSLALELIPAPAGLAWQKVVFSPKAPGSPAVPQVSLSPRTPRSRLRQSSPQSEIGLVRTLRLLSNFTAAEAREFVAANPALSFASPSSPPRSFGDFTVRCLFVLRDSTTGALGFCASVANLTLRRLLFDPESWVVRAGDRVYPIRTVDFSGELEPGATATAFLVLARDQDGEPTRLLPGNDFQISVLPSGSVDSRPVSRMNLEGFAP